MALFLAARVSNYSLTAAEPRFNRAGEFPSPTQKALAGDGLQDRCSHEPGLREHSAPDFYLIKVAVTLPGEA